jgi:hypothetical protein
VTDPPGPYWPLAVLIPLFAVLRLPGAPRNGGVVGYAAVAIATVCLTHAVFFGEDRYHMVLTPLLCLLAACAWRSRSDHPAAGAASAEPGGLPPPTPTERQEDRKWGPWWKSLWPAATRRAPARPVSD